MKKRNDEEYNPAQIIAIVAILIFLGLVFNIPSSRNPEEPGCNYAMSPTC